MAIRTSGLSRIFNAACVAAMLFIHVAGAQAQSPLAGQRAYWCNNANGAQHYQLEPCAAGMELRSGVIGPGGTIGQGPDQSAPVPTPAVEADRSSAPAIKALTASERKEANDKTLKDGQRSTLKLLGFGLVFGVIAKLLGRSFWRWLIAGFLVRIALVSLNLMEF